LGFQHEENRDEFADILHGEGAADEVEAIDMPPPAVAALR